MPALEIHSEWAKTLAEQLVASGDAPPAELSDDERLALAWALKDLAYAAWSTSPLNVPKAADALRCLEQSTVGVETTAARELHAISGWIAGVADLTRGRMSEAIARLGDATRTFRDLGQRAHAAHSQVSKIVALSTLGLHEEASECGASTLKELSALGEFGAAGRVSLNLGNLQYQLNNFYVALSHYELAARLFRQMEDKQWYVMSRIGMADSYTCLGKFDEALNLYAAVELETEQHNFSVLNAMVRESRSLVHLARGQYVDALAGLEGARQRYEALDMPQHLATTEKQFADAYLMLRLLPEALALYDKASARFESLEMPAERAWTLAQRGRTLAALARPQMEVAESLLQALQLFSAQGVSAGTAAVLHARAEVALALDDAELAVKLAQEAAHTFAQAGMATNTIQSRIVEAYALLGIGDTGNAIALFDALLDQARASQLISIQVRCLIGLGLSAVRQIDSNAAKARFESAIELFERQRGALPGDDFRHAFLVDHMRPYEELLRIELAAQAHDHLPTSPSRVLVRLERFRARALSERLGDWRSADLNIDADETAEKMRARLNWLHHRSQKLQDEGENSSSLLAESHRIELELLERARRQRLTAEADGTPVESADIDAVALLASLGTGEALIEYGVLDNELFACVVTCSGISLRRHMAKWSGVIDTIRAARFQIETLRNGAADLDKHLELLCRRSQTALRRLHDLIWAPLSDLLIGCNRVLVVPHEQLGSVPFVAMHDGAQYLSQRYEMAVAPSARVALRGLGRHSVPAKHAVIVGESSRLVHAAEEAQFVATLFDEATVLTGQDANGDILRAASAQADVLHLACHGQFRSDNPMFSALHLADGPFTVQDVEALRLPQGVVVLSACESGVATASKGDEVIGLVRAFLIAGAARVVASLWPVDDAVTTEFMAAFYASLRAGAAPAAALRSAQLEVMKTHPHPFHWAAFTVYGGW